MMTGRTLRDNEVVRTVKNANGDVVGLSAGGEVIAFTPSGATNQLTPPNSALDVLPIKVFKVAEGTYFTDFDPRIWEPKSFDATYYVSQENGNDASSGLTEALATKSIKQALTLIIAASGTNFELIIEAGYYDRLSGWAGQQIGSKNIVVRTRGRVVSSNEYRLNSGGNYELSWTLDTGAYKCTRSSTGVIYDKSVVDEYGRWVKLTPVADAATCQVTPNSTYTTGTVLWVNRADGLAPTKDNLMVAAATTNVRPAQDGRTIIYGMVMQGGNDGLSCNMLTNLTSDVILIDCEAGYTLTNAFDFNGARYCISKNCQAFNAGNDGFNYQMGTSETPQRAVEINCTAINFGEDAADENNNASSIHDTGRILRVNGIYRNSLGPVVNDTGTAVAWNINCTAGGSSAVTASQSAVFAVGAGATSYLEHCTSNGGATWDGYVAATGAMYVRDTPLANTSGSVSAY